MTQPARLFHLHFNVPAVPAAERALSSVGLPLHRRFGRVDGEQVVLEAADPVPDGFRLRLQNAQCGAANVTLAPGSRLRFDHLGIVVPDVDAVVDRAATEGWSARDSRSLRTFLATPWQFRIEVVAADSDVAADLGSWTTALFEEVVLRVPVPDDVRAGLDAVLGDLSALTVEHGDGRPSVERFRLGGDAFPDGREVTVADVL